MLLYFKIYHTNKIIILIKFFMIRVVYFIENA